MAVGGGGGGDHKYHYTNTDTVSIKPILSSVTTLHFLKGEMNRVLELDISFRESSVLQQLNGLGYFICALSLLWL